MSRMRREFLTSAGVDDVLPRPASLPVRKGSSQLSVSQIMAAVLLTVGSFDPWVASCCSAAAAT